MRISDWSSDVCSSDIESVDGRLGEPMALNFVGRSRLSEGRMLLYRAHRDIHSHRPPERLSISLNIMDEGEHVPWRDQYIVDLDRRALAPRPTVAASEMLLRCTVHLPGTGRSGAHPVSPPHPATATTP